MRPQSAAVALASAWALAAAASAEPITHDFADGTAGPLTLHQQLTQEVGGTPVVVATVDFNEGRLVFSKKSAKDAGEGVKDAPVVLAGTVQAGAGVAGGFDLSVAMLPEKMDYSTAAVTLRAGAGDGKLTSGLGVSLVNTAPGHPAPYELRLLKGGDVLATTVVTAASEQSTGFNPSASKRPLTLRLVATPEGGKLNLVATLSDDRGRSATVAAAAVDVADVTGRWFGFRTGVTYNNNGYRVAFDDFSLTVPAAP